MTSLIYIPEDGNYNPLKFNPYSLFNKEFEDNAKDIRNKVIKITVSDKKTGICGWI